MAEQPGGQGEDGTPIRTYCAKRMWTSGQAFSTTMILATEPVMVRFPASVLAMDKSGQTLCWPKRRVLIPVIPIFKELVAQGLSLVDLRETSEEEASREVESAMKRVHDDAVLRHN